jgi:hypothetical protein
MLLLVVIGQVNYIYNKSIIGIVWYPAAAPDFIIIISASPPRPKVHLTELCFPQLSG